MANDQTGRSPAARALRIGLAAALALLAISETVVRRETAAYQRGVEDALAPQERVARRLRAAMEDGTGTVPWPEHASGRLILSPDPSTFHRRLPEVNTTLVPTDPPRWLILGGTNVYGACEPGEHLGPVMTRVFLERTQQRVDTVNMGRLDGGPVNALRDYMLTGRRFDHQGVILVIDLGRDLERTVTPTMWHMRKDDSGKFEIAAPIVDRRERGFRALLRASALARLIDDRRSASGDPREADRQAIARAMQSRRGAIEAAFRQEAWFLHRSTAVDDGLAALREVLVRFQQQTREEGVPFVVLPLQTPRQMTPRPFAADSQSMMERLRIPADGPLMEDRVEKALTEMCAELGIRVVDMRPRWAEWFGAYPDDLIWWRADWNLSSRGHFVVGERLAGELEAENRAMLETRKGS
jgi:hypothetical protein